MNDNNESDVDVDVDADDYWYGAYDDDDDDVHSWEWVYLPVVLMKVASALTLLASLAVVLEAVADLRGTNGGGSKVLTRTQLALQLPIVCIGLTSFVGSWALPAGTPGWGAMGNIATCEAFGFVNLLGAALFPLDLLVSVLHILMVRYNWRDASLQKLEKVVHGLLVWPVVVGGALWALQRDMYNNAWNVCAVYEAPFDCSSNESTDDDDNDDNVECLRGDGALTAYAVIYPAAILCFLFAIFTMTNIWLYVRKLENRSGRYGSTGASFFSSDPPTSAAHVSRVRSRAVAQRGILYATVSVFTYLPYVLSGVLELLWQRDSAGLYNLEVVSMSLIGVTNSLVFFYHREHNRTRYGAWWKRRITAWPSCLSSSSSPNCCSSCNRQGRAAAAAEPEHHPHGPAAAVVDPSAPPPLPPLAGARTSRSGKSLTSDEDGDCNNYENNKHYDDDDEPTVLQTSNSTLDCSRYYRSSSSDEEEPSSPTTTPASPACSPTITIGNGNDDNDDDCGVNDKDKEQSAAASTI